MKFKIKINDKLRYIPGTSLIIYKDKIDGYTIDCSYGREVNVPGYKYYKDARAKALELAATGKYKEEKELEEDWTKEELMDSKFLEDTDDVSEAAWSSLTGFTSYLGMS